MLQVILAVFCRPNLDLKGCLHVKSHTGTSYSQRDVIKKELGMTKERNLKLKTN